MTAWEAVYRNVVIQLKSFSIMVQGVNLTQIKKEGQNAYKNYVNSKYFQKRCPLFLIHSATDTLIITKPSTFTRRNISAATNIKMTCYSNVITCSRALKYAACLRGKLTHFQHDEWFIKNNFTSMRRAGIHSRLFVFAFMNSCLQTPPGFFLSFTIAAYKKCMRRGFERRLEKHKNGVKASGMLILHGNGRTNRIIFFGEIEFFRVLNCERTALN